MCGCNELSDNVSVVGMPARLSWVLNETAAREMDNITCDKILSDEEKIKLKCDIHDFVEVKKRRWKYIVATNAEITRIRKKC